jgi:hypothetical protein
MNLTQLMDVQYFEIRCQWAQGQGGGQTILFRLPPSVQNNCVLVFAHVGAAYSDAMPVGMNILAFQDLAMTQPIPVMPSIYQPAGVVAMSGTPGLIAITSYCDLWCYIPLSNAAYHAVEFTQLGTAGAGGVEFHGLLGFKTGI